MFPHHGNKTFHVPIIAGIHIQNYVGSSHQEDGDRRSTRQNAYSPWANGWSTAELQALQLEDPEIGPILKAK